MQASGHYASPESNVEYEEVYNTLLTLKAKVIIPYSRKYVLGKAWRFMKTRKISANANKNASLPSLSFSSRDISILKFKFLTLFQSKCLQPASQCITPSCWVQSASRHGQTSASCGLLSRATPQSSSHSSQAKLRSQH